VSHLHVEDAASAIEAALNAAPGVYNVTDDEPVTTAEALSTVADLLGAPRPRRVPVAMARLAAGPAAGLLSVSHRVSNRRLRDATGWSPKYPSVLEGWRSVVEARAADRRSLRG
jgi:2-alkyl-3-oxoalkanoate reductase